MIPRSCRQQEESFYTMKIMEKAVAASVGIVSPQRIDEINILQATYEAMRKAVAGLGTEPDILLNDAVTISGSCYSADPYSEGRRKKRVHCGSQHYCKSHKGPVLWWNMKDGFRDMALLQTRDMVLQSILKRCGGWARPRFTETVLSVILSEHMEAAPGNPSAPPG